MNENEMNLQEPAFEEPVVAQKPKSKKGLWIGLAALVAMVVIAAIVIGMVTSSPLGLLATGFRNSMEAMENDAYTQLMHQVSNGGSMEFSADVDSLMLQGNRIPLDGTGFVKIYMNEEAQKTAMTLGVQLGSQKLDASIFGNQESVVLASDWLLGDKAYGVTLKDFVENFNKSVFRMDGPYSLGIELPENFQEQLDKNQKLTEAAEKVGQELAAVLLKSVEENSTVEKENATLTLGGDTVKTTAVSIKMDHNQLAAFFEDMLEYMRTDEDFKAYMEEYMSLAATVDGQTDTKALVEEFFQEMDRVAEEMEETKKQMEEEETGMEITFHITKSGKQLIGAELVFASNVEPGMVSIYAGPDLKNAKEFSIQIESGEESLQMTYRIKADDKESFVALLDICENDQDVLKADVRWDKQTGAWEIVATTDGEESVIIRGNLEQTEEKVSVTLESVEASGQSTDLGIHMVLRASDEMPEAPQYTEILKMTEAEVGSLVEELGMAVFQLAFGMVA